jgi:hypothetical protein
VAGIPDARPNPIAQECPIRRLSGIQIRIVGPQGGVGLLLRTAQAGVEQLADSRRQKPPQLSRRPARLGRQRAVDQDQPLDQLGPRQRHILGDPGAERAARRVARSIPSFASKFTTVRA